MDMLKIHEEASNEVNEAFHNFLLCFKANNKTVYGFVEGKEDPIFYRGIIEHVIPSDWNVELIIAGNKDKLIQTYSFFDWAKYKKNRICFFVDRDLSEIIHEDIPNSINIYVTDEYSIENSIVSFGLMKRTLCEVLGCEILDTKELDDIENYYSSSVDFFKQSMVPLMAQVIIWRQEGKRPCLEDINIKEFFDFSRQKPKIKSKYLAQTERLEYAGRCVNLQSSPINQVEFVINKFGIIHNINKILRGKYLFWFFVKISLMIHQLLPTFSTRFSTPPTVRISLGAGNAIAVLGSKGRCPKTLSDFLGQTFLAYINGAPHSQIQ